MSHKLHSPLRNSLLCALGRTDFCLKRFCYTIPNSLMLISWKYTSFEVNCNKTFSLEFARLKNARGSVSYRMSQMLQFQKFFSLRCGKTRCFLSTFRYTILNSLMLISETYISFWGNCNKISSSNLTALKTPVDRLRIGCHTRCNRHSKILYFSLWEDQIFSFNVSVTRF